MTQKDAPGNNPFGAGKEGSNPFTVVGVLTIAVNLILIVPAGGLTGQIACLHFLCSSQTCY
jgi:hypothetical protein